MMKIGMSEEKKMISDEAERRQLILSGLGKATDEGAYIS